MPSRKTPNILRFKVLFDSNEQLPLKFPSKIVLRRGNWLAGGTEKKITCLLTPEKRGLEFGDYTLAGFEKFVGVERKGSLDEVWMNTTARDRDRFISALARFVENVKHPTLLLDFPITGSRYRTPGQDLSNAPDEWAIDRIMWLVSKTNLRVVWGRSRAKDDTTNRKLGARILRLMLHQVLDSKGL